MLSRCTNSQTYQQLPAIGTSSILNASKVLLRSIFETITLNHFATFNRMICTATNIFNASILALASITVLPPVIFFRLLTVLQWINLAVLILSIWISAISHSPGLSAIKRSMLPFACLILQIRISTVPIRKRCT